jgi:hypothetical protein
MEIDSRGSVNNPQDQYNDLLQKAANLNEEITALQARIVNLNNIVPSLAQSLEDIKKYCLDIGQPFNPDDPHGPWLGGMNATPDGDIFFDEPFIDGELSGSEKEASGQIRNLEKELVNPRAKINKVKEQLQLIILNAIKNNMLLVRDLSKEAQIGLLGITSVAIETRPKSTAYNKSPRNKPGPKGPRPWTMARRTLIKSLKSKGINGLEACKNLNNSKTPLPSERIREIYNNDWVSWFHNAPNDFYRQWNADLNRK